jgi:polyhydroxybutyrate depolymerase
VAIDGCANGPKTASLPDTDPNDGTTTQSQSYGGCATGSGVILYIITGGGHTWPGPSEGRPKAGG